MLVLLWSGPLNLSANHGLSTQSGEWSLSLASWGAPWEKRFNVELSHNGALSVTEEDPMKRRDQTITKLSVRLPAQDLREIYQQAMLIFQGDRSGKKNEIADGTWINVKLVTEGKTLDRSYHVGQTEEEAPEVAKLFSLINKHLAKEHQVF